MNNLINKLTDAPKAITIGGEVKSLKELDETVTKNGYILVRLTDTDMESDINIYVDSEATKLNNSELGTRNGLIYIEGIAMLNAILLQCIVEIDGSSLSGQIYTNQVDTTEIGTTKIKSQILNSKPALSWGLDRIDQRLLPLDGIYHENVFGGDGVNVYFVDTGIDFKHDFLSGRACSGYDAFGGNGADELGNGTFLAGIVAAIAPNAKLHSIKILDGQANGSIEGILGAIEWITINALKPAVVNIAIGIPPNEELDNMIKDSIGSGITYVIEGGGANEDVANSSPSRVSDGIVVGASDQFDSMAKFSNYGTGVDIFAPGVDIVSSALGGGTKTMSGVQVAAAHVTGVVALHLGQQPNLTPKQVKEKLISQSLVGVVKDLPAGTPNRLLQTGIPVK